jgi:hypothetical protein
LLGGLQKEDILKKPRGKEDPYELDRRGREASRGSAKD